MLATHAEFFLRTARRGSSFFLQAVAFCGNTHLHCTVGERLQRHAEHHIESCDHSAAGQFADSEILIHNNTPADEF